jgi:hypothetical protein
MEENNEIVTIIEEIITEPEIVEVVEEVISEPEIVEVVEVVEVVEEVKNKTFKRKSHPKNWKG